jgi:hypothetical protein
VTHDTFKDTTPLTSEGRFGVVTSDTGEVLIAHNQFKGLATGIGVGAGAPAITDNRISGSHVVGMFGNAVSVSGGGPSMTGNEITNPDEPPMGSFINGVLVIGSTASLSSTNDLIQGFSYGIETQNAGTLTIDSDVILDSSLDGIGLIDGGSPDAALGNANATNLTVTGSGLADVEDNAHLDLDSSVAGDDGIDAFGSGSCTITNSRGPAGGGPSGCHSFSVNSNPKLKADGYHLKASSPMIDAGNPAPPSGGALDIDGDKRALDGTGNCNGPKQRDIGADEFRC